jgi:uncharacterized protein YjbJ (UPF0337 family)
MNWERVEGNWKQFKGKVKQQWGKLTDDHLEVIAGKRDVLSGKLQEAYGLSKDEAEAQIEKFENRYEGWSTDETLHPRTADSRRAQSPRSRS